jgi:magnesium transporter
MIDKKIAFGETHVFVGRGYVVSVRHGASTSYAPLRERCESAPVALSHGEDYILYAILDFIVDNYAPVLQVIHDEIEKIEDTAFGPREGSAFGNRRAQVNVRRMYKLRRDLLRLRRAVVPLAEVCNRLTHAEAKIIDPEMQPLFRDVTDHVRRLQDEIDSMREVLAFAFEASLMLGQQQQTAITRRLAARAAILAVPTAIAGIYGMNFEYMPELKWRYGYLLVIGLIAALCTTLFVRLRRNGWL